MPYKFIYFSVRGKAQQLRYLLEDNELQYEDNGVTFQEFGEKIKKTLKFGQLPALIDDGIQLVQSGAIIRHLARKHNLYGATTNEAVQIDMVHEGMVDERDRLLKLVFSKGDYEADKKEFISKIPAAFSPFEKILSENDGGKGFFVGKKISFADYMAYDVLVNTEAMAPKCFDSFPLLTAYRARIAARPNMAKYIASEKFKKMTITPSDRLK